MNQTACDAVGAGPSPLFTLGVVGAALLGAVALAFLILGLIATVWGRATARRLVADLQSRYAPLRRAPRELYLVYLMKLLESYGYFSFSLIMVLFLSDEFGQTDAQAGWVYGLFGMMITLYGLCVGVLIDNFGVRKSLILGSVLLLISRFSAMLTTSMGLMYVNLFLLMPLGTALGIPVLATAIRRYTTADSRAVAFGLFYAAMNVAALLSGPAADLLRGAFACGTWIGGVHLSAHRLLLLSSVVTTAAMLAIAILGVREIEIVDSGGGGGEPTSSGGGGGSASSGSGCGAHAIAAFTPRRGSPWGIAKEIGRTSRFWRFLLLVVLLVAVRLIFRHLDATLPKYLLRSHGPSVPYGLIYAINPALIIVLVPLVSAYTRHVPPLEMIKWGSLVAAASPFCLALSSSLPAAVAFVVILSIGEACYSPRFYEYATMAAPKGREGTYMALSSAPLFVAKLLAGGMSGVLLEDFCPAEPCEGGRILWLIIGLVTAISPVMLFACSSVITGGRQGRSGGGGGGGDGDGRQAEEGDQVELTSKQARGGGQGGGSSQSTSVYRA